MYCRNCFDVQLLNTKEAEMGLSYSKDKKEARFQYTNKEGKRKVLDWGRMSKEEADYHERFTKKIVACYLNPYQSMDRQTALYLEELSAKMKKKLLDHGLIQPTEQERREQTPTLGKLIDDFLEFHKEDKENTYKNIKLACTKLLERFGREKKIDEFTPTEINHYEKFLYRESAEATATRLVKRFRQIIRWAIEHEYCDVNPFSKMRLGKQENSERLEFVDPEKVRTAMSCCVNFELRLALFLARFAAFRTPSECNSWLWHYIDFENKRVKVWDVKRNEVRIIPLFGSATIGNMYPMFVELLFEKGCESFLRDLKRKKIDLKESLLDWKNHGLAIEVLLGSKGNGYIAEMVAKFPKDEDFVFSPEFRKRKSRSDQMKKLTKKAKVSWMKDFQNLRASCESEWVFEHDIDTATRWTGNTIEVARKHYLMIHPDAWDKATARAESGKEGIVKALRSLIKIHGMKSVTEAFEEISRKEQ